MDDFRLSQEIAKELTSKAIENGFIQRIKADYQNITEINQMTAKAVAGFYNTVLSNIKKSN